MDGGHDFLESGNLVAANNKLFKTFLTKYSLKIVDEIRNFKEKIRQSRHYNIKTFRIVAKI